MFESPTELGRQTPPLRRSPTMEQGVQASENVSPQKDKADSGHQQHKPAKGPIQRQPKDQQGQRRRTSSREERPPSRENNQRHDRHDHHQQHQDNKERESKQEKSSQGAKDRQGRSCEKQHSIYLLIIPTISPGCWSKKMNCGNGKGANLMHCAKKEPKYIHPVPFHKK